MIPFRHSARVVRGQSNGDVIVTTRPIGMVVRPFGKQRDARHEAKGVHKVLKPEGAFQGIFPDPPIGR